MKCAIDREAIVTQVFNRIMARPATTILSPRLTGSRPILRQVFKYDPDKAKFHLKKAGFETIKVDFSASDAAFPGAVDAGLL